MQEKLSQLKAILAEVSDLDASAELLGWDQQTYMPPASAEGRGYQLSTLGKISHDKFTSNEVGELLDDVGNQLRGTGP